jgi:hypothetical protein
MDQMSGDLSLNTVFLAIIALSNAVGAYFYYNTRNDIKTLEINTNSIKDALVERTAEAAEARGRDAERAVGESKAADLAKGNLEGRK